MLTTSLALGGSLFAAGAAVAADAPGAGVSAVLQPKMVSEEVIVDGQGVQGGLFTLKTENGEIQTYCIDFGHPVNTNAGVKYQESDWKSSSLGGKDKAPAAAKIRWILENSYPQVTDLVKLAKDAGVQGELTKEDAAAGTQAAIWKFSDDKNAVPTDPQAKQLRDYLVSDKNKGIAAEPKPSLSLTPDAVAGKPGNKLGPFTVNSSASEVKLSVAGDAADKVKLVDKDGKPVTGLTGPIAKDTQVFLDVPAGTPDGAATVTANADTVVPSGRVFLSKGYTAAEHSQTMILAGSTKLSVKDAAKAAWKQGKGALVESAAQVECDANGVRVSVANTGDEAANVTVTPGKAVTVQPGKVESVVVPVAEDAAYDITVTGPNGFSKQFKGVLDCKVATGTTPTGTPSAGPTTAAPTTPAPTGTPSAGATTTAAKPAPVATSPAPGATGGLAQTGGNDATPVIAAVAGALVVAGGAAVFVLRRRGRHGGSAA
ncbi:Cys-Gln thioester bond-forming surface protein [Streptomyces sp. CB01881]|uniref:Cys-Gln thioester bond-forming surface protein n=1 Tax=Streptomyces sp. CB01881 TaxID=2078691 RepID=UPI000CDBD2D7|nr:Cys-Gln thioester bond-forming surface protein [Streptomyces sp. CB01881]AUY49534.1 peptidase [Streptomyces sp. CB01881]TYC72924.1 TQXA domain-containing protein [Streptomyces sp. CB01881]